VNLLETIATELWYAFVRIYVSSRDSGTTQREKRPARDADPNLVGHANSSRKVQPAEMERPLCLRVADAARLLDISKSKAYDLINRGVLPAIRVGSSWRVRRTDLDRLLERGSRSNSDQ
jgi:excisionase family DNA binding protein